MKQHLNTSKHLQGKKKCIARMALSRERTENYRLGNQILMKDDVNLEFKKIYGTA